MKSSKIKTVIILCFVLFSVFLICGVKSTTFVKAEEVEQIGSDAIEEIDIVNNDEQTAKF